MNRLIAIYGITGSGKLELACRLQPLFGYDVHRADLILAEEFSGWPPEAAQRAAFERILLNAAHSLKAGSGVILTGSCFGRRDERVAARKLAEMFAVEYKAFHLTATPTQAVARLVAEHYNRDRDVDLLQPFFDADEFQPVMVTEKNIVEALIPEGILAEAQLLARSKGRSSIANP